MSEFELLNKALNQAEVSESQLVKESADKRNKLQDEKKWFIDRLGHFSGSETDTIKAGINTQKSFMYQLRKVGERLIDTSNDLFLEQIDARRWGKRFETDMIKAYEEKTKRKVKDVGFLKGKIKGSGSSLDGLVGKYGQIEGKCPYAYENHIHTLLFDYIKPEYLDQIQKGLYDSGRKWTDYISFDPRLQKPFQIKIIRIYPDLEMFEMFEKKIQLLETQVSGYVNTLENKYNKNK